jgi:folate-dependent phosphoribosylglycinamide formyltransferase PurN
MKILLLTGNHPRHFYLANQLAKRKLIAGHIIEERESFVPSPPADLHGIDRENFVRHFKDRDLAEDRFFSEHKEIDYEIPTYKVTRETLNSSETIEWIHKLDIDIAISYGVHKLNQDLLSALPEHAWNIHGGLSPWFRGNITLFWPFYMLRPNWAGMTIHRLTDRLDGGEIVHHSVPKLEYGDGVHDVACKAVMKVSEDIVNILVNNNLEETEYVPQKSSGKLYVGTDWTPMHLRLIYQTFDNNIVDHFLDGNLSRIEPKLVNALERENKQ